MVENLFSFKSVEAKFIILSCNISKNVIIAINKLQTSLSAKVAHIKVQSIYHNIVISEPTWSIQQASEMFGLPSFC